MKSSLRGELTNQSDDERFNLTNNDMVIAVAEYLKVTDNEDVRKISDSISPVLMNCVANTVSQPCFFGLTFDAFVGQP